MSSIVKLEISESSSTSGPEVLREHRTWAEKLSESRSPGRRKNHPNQANTIQDMNAHLQEDIFSVKITGAPFSA